jgi:signal transduction histidine kinase
MLNRLEDEFARQNAFVADASHELRTPLTIVRGQLEVLAMSESPDPQEMRRVQQIVLAEVDRMSRLVDDLVVLAHADDDRFLHLTQIDVPEFLAGICDSLRPTADRRVELAPIPPLVIECDPDRLAQAMRNLIANAFTHTDPGGLIEVAVEAHEDRVWFVVDDDGPGVSPEDRAHIFDRFTRLDEARGRASGGAGLGLSIVRAIAHAHGGEVRVERSPRGGARFVLDLLTTPPVRRRGGDRTPG